MADRPLKEVHKVLFPGEDREAGLVTLTCADHLDSEVEGRRWLRKRGLQIPDTVNQEDCELLRGEVQCHELQRALVDPESAGQPEHRLYKDADELRRTLTPDQRDYFSTWYARLQADAITAWPWPRMQDDNVN